MNQPSHFSIEQITYQLTWQIRHEVMWPNEPLDFVKLKDDPIGIHYGLWNQNRLWTVVSVFIDKDEAQFRKLATRTVAQNQGYGTAMLRHVMDELTNLGIKRLWCNARTDKWHFYQRLGFQHTGATFYRKEQQYYIIEKML